MVRRARRGWLVLLAACAALGAPLPSRAADTGSAVAELARSNDFRVRVNAAVLLGRARPPPPGAREALERALRSDVHATVRAAAAEALGALGDALALAPLERRLGGERSASVRAQIRASIERLHAGEAPADDGSARPDGEVRCVVAIGTMRNTSGVRGEGLRRVLADAARSQARVLRGVALVGDDAPALHEAAAARRVPIITLDGNVTQLTESRAGGSLVVHAAVEFAVRRDQTLRGTVSGAATTFGSGPALSDETRRRLQDDAVDGAVQSALQGAAQRLLIAAL